MYANDRKLVLADGTFYLTFFDVFSSFIKLEENYLPIRCITHTPYTYLYNAYILVPCNYLFLFKTEGGEVGLHFTSIIFLKIPIIKNYKILSKIQDSGYLWTSEAWRLLF